MASIDAVAAVVSPPPQFFHDDPAILSFYRDLVEPFGETVDESLLKAGNNVFHKDLADRLAADESMTGRQADLVVVAYALPDVHPFTAVASHLNMVFGGTAQSFAVSEQGLAAPFTALRIVEAFQRSGRAGSAVVTVLEQTTLPTRHPLLAEHQLVDSGVMLALGTGDGLRVRGVETHDDESAIMARLRDLADEALLVLGPWLPATQFPRQQRVAPGSYCTSVWLELARHWRQWQGQGTPVVLADLDPLTGRGAQAILDG
jgi:hypothetical protein